MYHAGRVHVRRTMCPTCIFLPGNRMHLNPGRVEQMRADADRDGGCIPCHETIHGQASQEAVCRGYFDRTQSIPLRLAIAMGVVEWVT